MQPYLGWLLSISINLDESKSLMTDDRYKILFEPVQNGPKTPRNLFSACSRKCTITGRLPRMTGSAVVFSRAHSIKGPDLEALAGGGHLRLGVGPYGPFNGSV